MRKVIKTMCVVLLTIFVFVFVLVAIYINKTVYEWDYFGVVGLSREMSYEKLIEIHGEPAKYDGIWRYYDGFSAYIIKREDGTVECVAVNVTDPKYRFGKRKIGVSSTAEEVKEAYATVGLMDDIFPGEAYKYLCYVDGMYPKNQYWSNSNIWVTYKIGDDNKVYEVHFQVGGP